MNKPYVSLQPSEAVLVQVAGQIYAAYISAGRVEEGQAKEWMHRSIREAIHIARSTDASVQSDNELD